MLHRHRLFFFLLFSASFFVATSSILFYAYGYRFSFERGIFIYTGSLSLKTNVNSVSIRIDDEAVSEKRLGLLNNSIHIAGINPGEHFVQVSAPGYHTWSKKIVIQSGLTTEFWNIALTAENYEETAVLETARVIKMFPAPNGLFATVKKNTPRVSVDILDIGGKENTEVFQTTEADFLPTIETNVEWAPESHKLIVPLIQNDRTIYSVVTVKTKESFDLNTATHVTTPIVAPRWDATTKDFLFFLSEQTLYRYDTRSPELVPERITDHVLAYDLSKKKLAFLSSDDGLVYQINGNGSGNPESITQTPLQIDKTSPYSLIVYDDTRLAIIEKSSGSLFVYNDQAEKTLKKIAENILSIQYSDDGKKLLLFTDHEISVYFNRDWEAQPFRAMDSLIQIARFSTSIKNVQWGEDYEHVIFSLGKNIKMIELDNRDNRDLTDLLVLDTAPNQILSRFNTNTLYVVNQTPLDSLAGNSVFSIVLPQYTTLFGF